MEREGEKLAETLEVKNQNLKLPRFFDFLLLNFEFIWVPASVAPIELPLRRNPFIVLIAIQLFISRKGASNLASFELVLCVFARYSYLTSNHKL
jgi:hypothetical protein